MIEADICEPRHLTVVEGPLAGERAWPAGVIVTRRPASIARLLARHDLLITHFGMTAFEALAVGIPVVLFNPTRYHERLGAAAGFPMIGTGTPRIAELKALLGDPARLGAQVLRLNESLGRDRRRNLSRVLVHLKQVGSTACPACGTDHNRVIARFADRTYRRCASCGIVSLESFIGRRKYDAGYFSSEYKAQYGRTYLEDFQAIRTASAPRAAIVRGLLGRSVDGVVLDVGCAYGPFLAALDDARTLGFRPGCLRQCRCPREEGAGLSRALQPGSKRSRESACLAGSRRSPCGTSSSTSPTSARFSPRPRGSFPAGGVFAFSTPNGRGISARRDMRTFLQAKPCRSFCHPLPARAAPHPCAFRPRAPACARHRSSPGAVSRAARPGRGEVGGRGARPAGRERSAEAR